MVQLVWRLRTTVKEYPLRSKRVFFNGSTEAARFRTRYQVSDLILVIDDEPQIRRIMREMLSAAGYEVDDARNRLEGLDKLRQFRPDLVLLSGRVGLVSWKECEKTVPKGSLINN